MSNLGTPRSPSEEDLREYLDEFLMDPYVVDYPFWLRAIVVRGIILRTRPQKSAKAYKKVWTEDGSPLMSHSLNLLEKIKSRCPETPISLGMRYGEPSLESALRELMEQGVEKIFLMPLYPQYALSTTESTRAKVRELIREISSEESEKIELIGCINDFYADPDYIECLAQSYHDYFKDGRSDEKPEHLLFSFHGVPVRHVTKTDPSGEHCQKKGACCETPCGANEICYAHHCTMTSQLVAKKLGLEPSYYSQAYQSKLGPEKWLEPSTESAFVNLAKKGIQNLAVICPSFVADCLETIEEIGMEGEELFLESGGKSFHMIPALNDRDDFASFLASKIKSIVA